LTLEILPVTTSFVGRTVVADDLQTPLAGVSISLVGRDGNNSATGCFGETVSDAAGNFMFTNLPPECMTFVHFTMSPSRAVILSAAKNLDLRPFALLRVTGLVYQSFAV
jgi:hypothetical protein